MNITFFHLHKGRDFKSLSTDINVGEYHIERYDVENPFYGFLNRNILTSYFFLLFLIYFSTFSDVVFYQEKPDI